MDITEPKIQEGTENGLTGSKWSPDEGYMLDVLYRKNYTKVYYHAMSYVKDRDTARDLAHDIFLKAFEKIGSFKGESMISTWLYSITRNHCLEHQKKQDRMFFEEIDPCLEPVWQDDCLEEEHDHEQRRHLLKIHLQQMTGSDREILYMKYTMNLPVKDIMRRLNLSESAVKMRLKRARGRIGESVGCSLYQVA